MACRTLLASLPPVRRRGCNEELHRKTFLPCRFGTVGRHALQAELKTWHASRQAAKARHSCPAGGYSNNSCLELWRDVCMPVVANTEERIQEQHRQTRWRTECWMSCRASTLNANMVAIVLNTLVPTQTLKRKAPTGWHTRLLAEVHQNLPKLGQAANIGTAWSWPLQHACAAGFRNLSYLSPGLSNPPTPKSCKDNPLHGHTHSWWSGSTRVKTTRHKQNTMATPENATSV